MQTKKNQTQQIKATKSTETWYESQWYMFIPDSAVIKLLSLITQ